MISARLDFGIKEYGFGQGKEVFKIIFEGKYPTHYQLSERVRLLSTLPAENIYLEVGKAFGFRKRRDGLVVITDDADFSNAEVVRLLSMLVDNGYHLILQTSGVKPIPSNIATIIRYAEIMPKLINNWVAYTKFNPDLNKFVDRAFIFYITSVRDGEQVYDYIINQHLNNENIWLIPDGDTLTDMKIKTEMVKQMVDRFKASGFTKVFTAERSDFIA